MRNRSPGEALLASPHPPAIDRGRKPSRRHSYIEPRSVHFHVEKRAHTPVHEERTVRFIEPEPVHHHHHHHQEPSYSTAWYYTEPRSYSFLQSTAPSVRRIVERPQGDRALSEYRDTLVTAPSHHQHQQRWSVYGATPSTDWRRSQSTPPDFHRRESTARVPIGDRLTRQRNHEFAIGVKLAESQTDLDTFNRMLDKRFGNSVGGTDRSSWSWRPTTNYRTYSTYLPSTYYTSPLFYETVCSLYSIGSRNSDRLLSLLIMFCPS